jgi:hypothetical protein
MIISHKHRYLFIEIPLTASWAIRHELVEHYDGEPILHKHASYPEFRRKANPEELDYFVFATVRNPLDKAVSRYCKYQTNHKGTFSDPKMVAGLRAEQLDVKKFEFVQSTHADFPTYFRRYHHRPFSDMIELSAHRLDYVIRYESLQEGFTEVLDRLGLEQVAPIPMMNRTKNKRRDFTSYYTSEIVGQTKRIFGPAMKKWDYQFPAEWGDLPTKQTDYLRFRLICLAQRAYLLHVRYNDNLIGKLGRQVRAWLS